MLQSFLLLIDESSFNYDFVCSQFLINNISYITHTAIIAMQVRHRLRKDYGIEGGIPVVFSLEKPKAKLLPFKGPSGEEENPSDYQVSSLVS